jgi:hypothetical protein
LLTACPLAGTDSQTCHLCGERGHV